MNKNKIILTDKDIIEGNKLIAEFMVPNWELLKGDNYDGSIIDYLQNLCDKLNVWPHRDKKLNELGI